MVQASHRFMSSHLRRTVALKFRGVSQENGLNQNMIKPSSEVIRVSQSASCRHSKLPPFEWRPINVEISVLACTASGKGVFDNYV